MNKNFTLLTIAILTMYIPHAICMQAPSLEEVREIEIENSIIAQEIYQALQVLSPEPNETVAQRYAQLLHAYKENPYSMVTSQPQGISLEQQATLELQEIQYAFYTINNYQLSQMTRAEIEGFLSNFMTTPTHTQANLDRPTALAILGFDPNQNPSWRDISDQYEALNQNFELDDDTEITEDDIEQIELAYNFLLEHTEKNN